MDIGQPSNSIGLLKVNKGQDKGRIQKEYDDIVFNKSIFTNIFNKDIRRVFIYKKAERLASSLYLIMPAFTDSVTLRDKAEHLALSLTEAASAPPARLRERLSRELLELSGLLALARAGALLSPMNAEIIAQEAQALLVETAEYEEPRITLAEGEPLTALTRRAPRTSPPGARGQGARPPARDALLPRSGVTSSRQESILGIIKDKGTVSIKDISLMVRGVSDKTIQRELLALIEAGQVRKQGERRWSTYSLV